MRIWAIMQRLFKELLRDKRTLALILGGPVIVLVLLNVLFSVNMTTHVRIAAVDVKQELRESLDDVKHISVTKYSSKKEAKKDITKDKTDTIIKQDDNHFNVTYANTDSSKTSAVKQALRSVLIKEQVKGLAKSNGQLVKQLKQLTQSLPPEVKGQLPSQNSSSNKQSAQKTKISNHYWYGDSDTGFFDKIVPIILSFFVFLFVFLISGLALLKERTSGTLDRLLATPVKRSDIVFGYMGSYGLLAILQTLIIIFVAVWLLKVEIVGNIWSVLFINILVALVALAFGILLSTFAESEFQMIQFIPLIIVPQLLFSGLIPLDSMPNWAQVFAGIMPLKYAGDAQASIILYGKSITTEGLNIAVLLLFLVVLTIINVIGLKRYRKV